MTPRSAAERGPGTAAGRALLEIAGTEGQPTGVIRDAILAIEAEAGATAAVPLDAAIYHEAMYGAKSVTTHTFCGCEEVAAEYERIITRLASAAADAWQAGYEACWNRLNEAGRLLPSDEAAAPLDADMERPETLALLFLIADCVVQMAEKASPDAGRRRAQLTRAAEMMDARLASADEEGGTL